MFADEDEQSQVKIPPTPKRRKTFWDYFTKVYAWFVNLGPFSHAGVSWLGAIETFAVVIPLLASWGLHLALGGTIDPSGFEVGLPVAAVALAAATAFFCGMENWGLEVPEAERMIHHDLRVELQKSWDEYQKYRDQLSIKLRQGFDLAVAFQYILIHLYVLRYIIPDVIFRIWFAIRAKFDTDFAEELKKLADAKKLTFHQQWLKKLTSEPWLETILKPFIRVFGPIAVGAEAVMGMIAISIPLLVLIGGFASQGFGLPVPLLAVVLGGIVFVMSATQTSSLYVPRAISQFSKGFKGIWQSLKRGASRYEFAKIKKHSMRSYDETNLPEWNRQKIKLLSEKWVKNNSRIVKAETYIPAEDYLGEIERVIDLNSANHPRAVFDSEEGTIYSVAKIKDTNIKKPYEFADEDDEGTNKESGEHVIIDEEENFEFIIRKKGFFEWTLPMVLGPIVAVVGPILACGVSFLGFITIVDVLGIVNDPGVGTFVVGGFIGLIGAILNLCLHVETAINLLKEKGAAFDKYLLNIRKAWEKAWYQALFVALLKPLWELVPNVVKKIGKKLYDFGRYIFHLIKYAVSFILDKRDWRDELRKVWHQELSKEPNTKHGWANIIFGPLVSIFGSFGHGAEAFRAILLPLAIIAGTAAISTALSGSVGISAFQPWMLALAVVPALVAALENQSLEVKRALKRLDSVDEKHVSPILDKCKDWLDIRLYIIGNKKSEFSPVSHSMHSKKLKA